ncbi:MAG TPA: hypothetical protein VH372_00720 [Actinospica sp.]|nr:hypothetical protein [Actinospica sp.]
MTGELGTGPGGSPRLRVAEVFDGRGPTGEIMVDRPPVDPAEFAALTAYLTKAPVALATTKTGEDELSPGAGLVVPRAYHTDGEWIWPAAVGYYLHRYRLPPQPELVAHIRDRGFEVGFLAEELRQAAAAQMLEILAAAKRPQPVTAVRAAAPAHVPPPVPAQVEARAPMIQPAPAEPDPVLAASASASPAVPLYAPNPNPPAVKPAEPTLWMPAPADQAADEPLNEPANELVEEPKLASAFEAAAASAFGPRARPADEVRAPAVSAAAPAESPLTIPSFSTALTAAGNRHAAWVYEQIETFLDYMPLDEWSVDHGTRRYRQAGREFYVDALGRLAHDGRWIWAWAESSSWSADPALTQRSRLLRDAGGRLGIKELMAPVLDLSETADADDPEIAAEMLAWTAMGVAGARGYIGHTITDEGRIYYLAFDETIPMARPDIDGVPHFLSHGIAKFEEDATDCVLGYVEHYGWDWSRSAEGIVVSAGELGSFTADLSEDGLLTGISLHR